MTGWFFPAMCCHRTNTRAKIKEIISAIASVRNQPLWALIALAHFKAFEIYVRVLLVCLRAQKREQLGHRAHIHDAVILIFKLAGDWWLRLSALAYACKKVLRSCQNTARHEFCMPILCYSWERWKVRVWAAACALICMTRPPPHTRTSLYHRESPG